MSRRPLDKIEQKIRALVPGYLARRAADVDALRTAWAAGDRDRIAAIGHGLRGTGATYGQVWISEIGARLEETAERNDLEAVAGLIEELSKGLARARSDGQMGQRSR